MADGARVVVMWGAGVSALLVVLGLLLWLVLGRLGEILWELRALRSELASDTASRELTAESLKR